MPSLTEPPLPRQHSSTLPPSPSIRPLRPGDRASLHDLITRDGLFPPGEVQCALELIDGALASPDGDYWVRVADLEGRVAGYICFGSTPMTDRTWDLYWIATHPGLRGRGVGSALVLAMEGELRVGGARCVRVETSHQEDYGAAHRFYLRHDYPEVARFRDFYKPGDDLIILLKQL
ncbi:MAG: GNAT family N-acetyltransferase [Myxococcales bacterium]|nr:GNAT family N-acetyltransferase [Myxococcales bacterium]